MVEAQRITDAAFTQICGQIAPGMTEKQLYAKLIAALYENGADGLAFDPIVVSGPNTSMPHGVAGQRQRPGRPKNRRRRLDPGRIW